MQGPPVSSLENRKSRHARTAHGIEQSVSEQRAPDVSLERSLLDLSGQSALVTGANQGIGWAIATLLAQQGARVAINYPDDKHLPEQYTTLGEETIALKADVGDV